MKPADSGFKVTIFGRELAIACAEEDHAALAAAASFLDKRMREIQRSGKVLGIERCAIMAALNITHDYLKLRDELEALQNQESQMRSIKRKIDIAMQEQQQLL